MAPTYFTYKPKPNTGPIPPGSTPKTPANTLKLGAGQTTGYTPGKGYYAKPAVKPPAKPPGLGFDFNPGGILNDPGVGSPAPPPVAAPAAAPYDFQNAINNDWEMMTAQAEANKMNTDALSGFQKQLRQAYIDYGGGDTTKLGEWAQYIDQPTVDAALANKFSALAQNRQASAKASAQAQSRLAARGMLSSGDTTNTLKNILGQREQADYGAQRSFMGGASQGFNALNTIAQQARDRIAAARAAAAGRAADMAPINEAPTVPGGTPAAAAAPAWGGISWGGKNGITTKAGLIASLAPGVTWATWAKNHPAAAAKLT